MNYSYKLWLLSVFIVVLSGRQILAQEETPEQVQASTSKLTEKPLQPNSQVVVGPVSIRLVNEPVISAIKKIAGIVRLRPVLDYDLIKSDRKINLTLNVATLAEALDQVLEGMDIQYSITESGLLVFRQDEKPQLQSSTIRGVVTDASSNEKLIGVNVTVQGTSLGAATDIEGEFRIAGIPARVFTIKISCIGYQTQTIKIDFSKTEDVRKNVQMKPQMIEGEEVVVTAQMRGQLAAINEQIMSNTVVNVVSEEKIQELPDANAAEAIGRLPGVSIIRSGGEASGVVLRGLSSKFSNITIDGVKIPPTDPNSRDVDLSVMSQGALAGIELYKTLTPDQDADAIAGGINMVTKKAPTERLLRADLKGGYNYLMASPKQYDLSLRYGERFFNDLIGIQLQGNAESKIRSQENISYSYSTSDNTTLASYGPINHPLYNIDEYDNDYQISAFTVRFTDETRKRNGGQAIIDYNTPDSGSIKLTGVYAQTNRNYMIYERVYPTWVYNFENIEQNIVTRNTSLQGKNYLLGLTVDWNASYAESKVTNPEDFRTMFTEPAGGTQLNIKDHPEQFNAVAINDFTHAYLDSMDRSKTENFHKETTFQLNLSKSISLGNLITNEIKAGAKYKATSRWMDSYGYTWNTYQFYQPFLDASGNPIDFSGTPFTGAMAHTELSRFVDMNHVPTRDLLGQYRMTPLINLDTYNLFESYIKNATLQASINYGELGLKSLSNYFVTENVTSAYLMDDIDFGQSITLMVGARVEKEDNVYNARFCNSGVAGTGNVLTINPKFITDTTLPYQTTIWLPNAQLTIKPTDFLTVRFAAYQALARPDFNLRLPQLLYSTTGASVPITAGNPGLKDVTSWNYEANTQIYSSTLGLISVNAYYKRIENMYHTLNAVRFDWYNDSTKLITNNNVILPNSQVGWHRLDDMLENVGMSDWANLPAFHDVLHKYSHFTVTTGYNSPNPSYTWGFEFQHDLNFRFLPVSWMQNIVLSYNIAIARSETNVYMEKSSIDTVYTPGYTLPPIKPGFPSTVVPPNYNAITVHTAELLTKPMEDQPQLTANVSLGYDLEKWGSSVRISMFYQSQYTRSYSANSTSDGVVGEFIKWDLSFKQRVTSNVALMLNIDNLFNRTETRYRYNNVFDWGYLPTAASSYGTTIDFGARVSL
jgi:TonB-dependent receptor